MAEELHSTNGNGSATRVHLERILASRAFASSERHRRFLQFAVESHLAGSQPKEYQFGLEVFGRSQDFDPRIDTVVRVEAHRLRARLKKYYETEGLQDDLILEFPSGGYLPVVRSRNGHAPPPSEAKPNSRFKLHLLLASAAVSLAVAAFLVLRTTPSPTSPPSGRFALLTADHPEIRLGSLNHHPILAISPDGQTVAFIAKDKAGQRLFLRTLDQIQPRGLSGTEGASRPFFSPDSRWIGFFAQGSVKKVSLTGGDPLIICKADGHGATWGTDGTIVIGGNPYRGLQSCPASGGDATSLLPIDRKAGEVALGWPRFLPDGEHFLFGAWLGGGFDHTPLYTFSLKTRKRKLVAHGSHPVYSHSGHLLYARDNTILSATFDLRTHSTGPEVPLEPNVAWSGLCGVAHFDVSPDGSLVFVEPQQSTGRPLLLASTSNDIQTLVKEPLEYYDPRLSPDGKQLSVSILSEGHYSLRIINLASGASRPLNNGPHRSVNGIWSPDGKSIAFASDRDGPYSIYLQPADGSAGATRLTVAQYPQYPISWAPDGSGILIGELNEKTGHDISWLPLRPNATPTPFLNSAFEEESAEFSPDGQWVTYLSNQSGRRQVYLTRFRTPSVSWQVTTDGAVSVPSWTPRGDAIVFQRGEELYSSQVMLHPTPSFSKPRLLLRVPVPEGVFAHRRNYEHTRDGRGFIILSEATSQPTPSVVLFTNWSARTRGRSTNLAHTSPSP